MKNFVKVMDNTDMNFKNLTLKFPKLNEKKLRRVFSIIFKICELFKDSESHSCMTSRRLREKHSSELQLDLLRRKEQRTTRSW